MWLIIPLIYFLGWWQTGSFRQALNGTIAWIIAFSVVAIALLAMDVGGFSGMTATPDSPAAAIAILGGFIGMWISNYVWRRRGGDPPRNPGKWERSVRAMLGMNGKKKKKKSKSRPTMQGAPNQSPPPMPQQQPVGAMPADAQYRPVQPAPQPQQQHVASQAPPPEQRHAPPQYQPGPAPVQQFQQQPAPPPQGAAPTSKPSGATKGDRRSPTADKYAKATGRALGAMFRGSTKKKPKNSSNR